MNTENKEKNSKIRIAFVVSTKDPASINIKEKLIENFGFSRIERSFDGNDLFFLEKENYSSTIYTIEKEKIFFDEVNSLNEDYIIFPSEHRSEKKIPSLTVHTTGVWSEDISFGGKPKTLSIAWPAFIKESFRILIRKGKEYNLDDIMITPEVTHHGPFVKKPHAFVEIGSTEKEWNNPLYGKIIAETIIETLDLIFDENYHFKYKVAVGIGGTHYCSSFIKIFLSKEYALSHICPKYANAFLDENLIIQSMNASVPKASLVILDWKGIQDKQRIMRLLENLKIPFIKTKNIKT